MLSGPKKCCIKCLSNDVLNALLASHGPLVHSLLGRHNEGIGIDGLDVEHLVCLGVAGDGTVQAVAVITCVYVYVWWVCL